MDISIFAYMANLFKWANVFISFFIILIAFSFFQRTKPHNNRTPWVILFVAVITFFIFELSNALFPNLNPIMELRDFFKTLFVAFILYVFVYERYLIEHSKAIVIEKKDDINEKTQEIASKPKVDSTRLPLKEQEIKKLKEDTILNDDNSEIFSASDAYVDPEILPPRQPSENNNPNDPLLKVTLREPTPPPKAIIQTKKQDSQVRKSPKKSKAIKKKKPSSK